MKACYNNNGYGPTFGGYLKIKNKKIDFFFNIKFNFKYNFLGGHDFYGKNYTTIFFFVF